LLEIGRQNIEILTRPPCSNWRRSVFIPNEALRVESIPAPDAPLEEIRRFAESFDAGPGTPRYKRGCLPEDWDDSPKSLSHLRSVLYAGFHGLAWGDGRETQVRQQVERIRRKVERGQLE
jgi:hypothetical protein